MTPGEINVLIACEESQAVCIEFRKLGFNAFSCDLQECSGGHPEWHLCIDVFEAIKLREWHCMIAFPPCTHLAVSGARHFEQKRKDGRQQQGIDFFMSIVTSSIRHKAIENPVGIMSSLYRNPDQIIQPFYFGDCYQKTTCLWLYNLPLLQHYKEIDLFNDKITHTEKGEFVTFKSGKRMSKFFANSFGDGKIRSKTFPGISKAMATQWGEYLLEKYNN